MKKKRRTAYAASGILALISLFSCSSQKEVVKNADPPRAKDAIPVARSAFLTAMEEMDFSYPDTHSASEDESIFAHALRTVFAGDAAAAESEFEGLLASTKDSKIAEAVADALIYIYLGRSAWNEYADLKDARAGLEGGDGEGNGDSAFYRAYAGAAREVYSFTGEKVEVPMRLTYARNPVIDVVINGKKRRFWIDTGASLTVLSSDVAKACGVKALDMGGEKASAHAVMTDVAIQPAVIGEFKIGPLLITNHPAMIIGKKDMEFRFLGIPVVKIDGVIGWNAIRNMDLEIDFKGRRAVIRSPKERKIAERDLFWLGYPVVAVKCGQSRVGYFALDTGSGWTTITDHVLPKLENPRTEKRKVTQWGMGGSRRLETKRLYGLRLEIDGAEVNFEHLNFLNGLELPPIPKTDGLLGDDAFSGGKIRIDYQNGDFSFQRGG